MTAKTHPEPIHWTPPDARKPTPWQLRAAAKALASELGRFDEALRSSGAKRAAARTVEVLSEGLPRSLLTVSKALCDHALAAALVSDVLGFNAIACVDLAGLAEQCLLDGLVGAVLEVAGCCGPAGTCDDIWVGLSIECLGVQGHIWWEASWDKLWLRTVASLAQDSPAVSLPPGVLVEVRAVIDGPRMPVARLLSMGVGEVIELGEAGRCRATIVAGQATVGYGRVGGVRTRRAVQIERITSPCGGYDDGS
ncbi:MAG: FliM/FliN family flagellar motor switch protein [Armatimonadetes bacterium]|nr:FliM/FliN family flagellar motor switch protein [Armatimonadota bacterium]